MPKSKPNIVRSFKLSPEVSEWLNANVEKGKRSEFVEKAIREQMKADFSDIPAQQSTSAILAAVTTGPREFVPPEQKPKSKRFQKPTAQQVTEYARYIKFKLDGQAFVDFYESKGWKVGNTPMKDWQAAVRTWKTRDNGNGAKEIKRPTEQTPTWQKQGFPSKEAWEAEQDRIFWENQQ